MSTLNLKVLLKNANRTFGFTTLVWIATALAGTAALAPTGIIGLPFYQLLILSLVFSTPALLVIAPALWIRLTFPTKVSKFLFTISIAVIACIAVIVFFLFVTKGYPLEGDLILSLLIPYVIASLLIVPLALYYFANPQHENKN
jgi:hypothetical protein